MTVGLETQTQPCVEFGVNIWAIIVSVYISLCLTSEKSKFPPSVMIFSSSNCDPDQWKRSLPSFVDKLPNRFPVFSSLSDTSFPRTRHNRGSDPIFMQVISHVTQGGLASSTTALYLAGGNNGVQSSRNGGNAPSVAEDTQKMETEPLRNPPSWFSHYPRCLRVMASAEQSCRATFSESIW